MKSVIDVWEVDNRKRECLDIYKKGVIKYRVSKPSDGTEVPPPKVSFLYSSWRE